jgi:hypothetical protein
LINVYADMFGKQEVFYFHCPRKTEDKIMTDPENNPIGEFWKARW